MAATITAITASTTAAPAFKGVTITVPVLEGNLFAGSASANMEGIDTQASVRRYCALIEEQMVEQFPGITVEHEIQWNTEGTPGKTYVSDWDREDVIRDGYDTIAERVFNGPDWFVETK